jgi:hypothetical protein
MRKGFLLFEEMFSHTVCCEVFLHILKNPCLFTSVIFSSVLCIASIKSSPTFLLVKIGLKMSMITMTLNVPQRQYQAGRCPLVSERTGNSCDRQGPIRSACNSEQTVIFVQHSLEIIIVLLFFREDR